MRHLDHQEAIRLRMLGKSYNEIAKDLDVGKSMLSYWLKDLQLPLEAKKILELKSNYSKEKFVAYNHKRHEIVEKDNKEIKDLNSKKIKAIDNYNLLLLGATLYWGEGQKRHAGKRPYPCVSFSNSDPDMIRFFLRFLREILKVPEEKIRPSIHFYPSTDKESAINFWSEITQISNNKLLTTIAISRASQGKRPKNLLPYGTLQVRVHSRKKFFEIMGLIDGLIKQSI